nr:hypothetical protein [Tanacetum cinerariifolium]
MPQKSVGTLSNHLHDVMAGSLPVMVDKHVKEQVEQQKTKEEMEKMISKAILQERGNIHVQISLQIQQAIVNDIPSQVDASVWSYLSRHILHVHPAQPQTTSVPEQQYQLYLSMKDDHQTLVVRPRDQDDPHDDAHPEGEKSAKRHKTSNCQRDPEAPALSLINQDLLYLKKGISRPEKIVLSLHKFPVVVFNDDDIKEPTSRWVNKYVKKFNPYARYGVEHWKNLYAKIFYIRKQKEHGKPKEVIYLNSKIIQVIKTYWELGYEHKFITEIVARRANECIVSITEPDFKNLNKNNIEDMYLLIINEKVPDYVETGLLWSLSVFIRSSVIWERVHDFNLELKAINRRDLTKDEVEYLKLFEEEIEDRLKYTRDLTKDEVEYLKLFEEEIEVYKVNEKVGVVCEWKTTWTEKRTPRIIDP